MMSMQEDPQISNRRRRRRKWRIALGAAFLFITGAIIENVAGNIGSNILIWLWERVAVYLRADYWPWLITLLLLVVAAYFWWTNRYLNQALNTSTNLNELDDSLLRLLGSWDKSQDSEMQIKHMLVELLRDARREFGEHVQRAFILLPDSTGGEYLRVWAHSKMPQESVNRMRFYIGKDSQKQHTEGVGVAGEVFLRQRSSVAHMLLTEKGWQCDHDKYKSFAPREADPVYQSFVCMPIYGPPADFPMKSVCLGVVCFDSSNKTTFDSTDTEVVLRFFARRIATTVLIYRLLSEK